MSLDADFAGPAHREPGKAKAWAAGRVAPKQGGFQVFADLDEATYEALKESIRRRGVLVPIAVDQHGRILDGHNRVRAAAEVGVDCPQVTVHVVNHQDGRDVALLLNTVRRHLDVEQRRQVVADLRTAGHSLRAIAGAVGVSKSQVAKDVEAEELSTGGQLAPERSTGLDGKTRPSTRPAPHESPAPPPPPPPPVVAAEPDPVGPEGLAEDEDRCCTCGEVKPDVTGGWCSACWEETGRRDAMKAFQADDAEPAPAPLPPAAPPRPALTAEEVKAAEDLQQWRLDTAAMCRGLAEIGVGLEVEGHAERLAAHWDADEANRTLNRVMRWVATPDGMRRVAGMIVDFADLWESTTSQEATG